MTDSSSQGSLALAPPTRRTSRRAVLAVAGAAAAALLTSDAGLHPPVPLVHRCRFGAWAGGGAGPPAGHRRLEALLHARLPIFSWFKDWGAGWDAPLARRVAALTPDVAYDLVVGWEAWNVDLGDVALGAHDRFLADFFDGARTYPGVVILRLFHEMNGNWYPWSVAAPGRRVADLEQWKQAWRRVVGVARLRKADNVVFAFCANADDVGGLPVEGYWPGSDWVDLVGLDGYNWGWNLDGNPQRTAEQLVEPMYRRVTEMHPTAEVIVGEIGCAAGAAKAEWHRRLYLSPRFPRLTRLAFFDERKERDWRLESDVQSLAVNRRFLREAPLAEAA